MKSFDHVVIGNSAAGVGAIEAVRKAKGSRKEGICVISEENTPAYSKPFIGRIVDGRRTVEELWYRPPEFYEDGSLCFMGGRRAVALNLDERTVELQGGERLGFGKLLIATGGSPIIPNVPGLRETANTFVRLSDALAIKKRIDQDSASSAVVLGGGLTGIAATSALIEKGIKVTLVELAPRILSTILDEEASTIIQEALDLGGGRTITGHTISHVDDTSERPIVHIDNGEAIHTDLIVVAIGVKARTELVSDTEITVDRGIVVNSRMETGRRGIYAAGDCAQIYDSLRGRNMVLALWPTAYMGGRVAGQNMAGGNAELEWSTNMNSLNYFDTPILSAGVVSPGEGDGWSEIKERNGDAYRKIVTRDDVMKGFVLVGDIDRGGLYLQMMRGSTRMSKLKRSPLSEDFGLVDLPTRERRRIWKEAVTIAGP